MGAIPVTGGDGLGEEELPGIIETRVELVLERFIELDAGGEQIRVTGGRLTWDEEQLPGNIAGANLAQRLGLVSAEFLQSIGHHIPWPWHVPALRLSAGQSSKSWCECRQLCAGERGELARDQSSREDHPREDCSREDRPRAWCGRRVRSRSSRRLLWRKTARPDDGSRGPMPASEQAQSLEMIVDIPWCR